MKYILSFLLVVLLPTVGQAQNAEQMLQMHQDWSLKNTPLASELTDEQLLEETTRAITSVARETEQMDIVRETGQRFRIEGMKEYADNRENCVVDPKDEEAKRLLRQTLSFAKSYFGENSLATIRLYPWLLYCLDMKERKPIIPEFLAAAQTVNQTDPSLQSKELLLQARLYALVGDKDYEDLSVFKDFLAITEEIVEFYAENNQMTHYRWMAYMVIWRYSTLLDQVYAYHDLEISRSRLYKTGHGCLAYLTAESKDVETDILNFTDFFNAAKYVKKHLLHEQHPDVQLCELYGYQYGIGLDAFVTELRMQLRLKHICDFFKTYYGSESPVMADVHSTIRRCTDDRLLFDDDVWDYDRDLMLVRKFDNGAHWMLINTCSNIFFEKMSWGEPGEKYAEEFLNLLQKYHSDDFLEWLGAKAMVCVPLVRMGIVKKEEDLIGIIDEYLQFCDNEPSWECVSVGKKLLAYMSTYFKDLPTCVALAHAIIKMEKTLAGEDSDLFACEYFSYGTLPPVLHPYVLLTLDGHEDMDALYDDIFRVCEGSCVPKCATRLMAGIYYAQSATPQKAIPLLKEAEESWDADNVLVMRNYPNKCPIYIMQMFCYMGEQLYDADSLEYYAQKLEQEIGEDFAKDYTKFEGCNMLVEYFLSTKRMEKALNIAQQCYNAYDLYGYPKGDEKYIKFVSNLLNIYGNINNDMDACQQIVDRINSDMKTNRLVISPEIYLNFMKLYCGLVEQKEPNNMLRIEKILWDIAEMYGLLPASSQTDINYFLNFKMYVYTQYVRMLSRKDQLMVMAGYSGLEDHVQDAIQTLSTNIREMVIPEMESRKEETKEKVPGYYPGFILSLAMAYNSVDSIDKAEYYYKESFRSSPQFDSGEALILFYMNHNRLAEASELCDTLATLMNQDLDEWDKFVYKRLDFEGLRFRTYYSTSLRDKAIASATRYKQLAARYIEMNLDLMTETERENFISTYGAGGFPLMVMLPHDPTLAGKTYDAILEEKGLLLRASERVEKSIRASGNASLVAKLDSLQAMRAMFSSLQMEDKFDHQKNMAWLAQQQQLQHLEREVAREAKQYMSETTVPKWQEVRKGLKAGEAAVEYIVSDSVLMALVLKRDFSEPCYVRLADFNDLKNLFDHLANASQEAIAEELYVKDSYRLYEKIWKPVQDVIGNASTVYYSPTGFLNAISFAAIKTESGACLIDKVDLHQMTTTGRLAQRKQLKQRALTKKTTVKVYGALCYDESQIEDYDRCANGSDIINETPQKRGAMDDFPFLDNTWREVNQVQQLLESTKMHVEVRKAMEATETEFRSMGGKSPDILHISTHGFFYPSLHPSTDANYVKNVANLTPMTLSGLALSNALPAWYGEKCDSSSDNILSSAEVATLDLHNTGLVFLSACQTGLGGIAYDGVFGVQRGFKKAGVDALCVSLWRVNDSSTASLSTLFYKNIAKHGMNYHAAFSEAQKKQRLLTPHPYDWASFVMIDAPF